MNVAIFGGTGFVGNYILDELESNNYIPQLLIREASKYKINQSKNYKVTLGDISDSNAIANTLKGAEIIIYNIGGVSATKCSAGGHLQRRTGI